jgi:hypothetical protein
MNRSLFRRYLILAILMIAVAAGIGFWLWGRRATSRATAREATADTAASHAERSAPSPGPTNVASAAPRGAANAPAAAVDYAAGLDEARGYRDPMLRSREFGRLLRAWVERDAEAALAYIRRLPPGGERSQAVMLALQTIGRQDPDRALMLAGDLVSNREEAAIYSALFAQLAEADPAGAAQKLEPVPGGVARENALRAVADAWAHRDLLSARSWAEKLGVGDRDVAIESVALTMIERDPLPGLELAQKYLHGPTLERVLSAGLPKLADVDAPAAAAIVPLLPAGETQVLAAADVARRLAARNPAEAVAWAKSLSDGRAQQVAVNNAVDAWARVDASAAATYVAQFPAGPTRVALVEHFAAGYGSRSPLEAVGWAESLPADGTRQAAQVTIASAWAQHDPAAANRWASTLPTGAAQEQALAGALSYWVLHDAQAAQSFVAGLNGDAQMHAAASIAPQLAQQDPIGAINWAQSLGASPAREAALVGAFTRWRDNAPSAADAWLASANLSAELKARLLRHP